MKSNKLIPGLFLILLIVLPLMTFGNDRAGGLFEKANQYYSKGQYKEALNTYLGLINEGYQSTALYFNTGNAEYKLGEIPSALLYYEKARKLSPGDEDINFNIRFANLKTTDKIDAVPEFFLSNWWKKIILSIPLNTLGVSSVIFFLIASAILIFYFFANSVSQKKLSFYTSITLFGLGLLCIFVANRQANYFNGHKEAIIFSTSIAVKSGPVNDSGTLFILHEGTKVNVLESDNKWIKIRLANGNQGWINATDIKEI